jgi:hypothetical protein
MPDLSLTANDTNCFHADPCCNGIWDTPLAHAIHAHHMIHMSCKSLTPHTHTHTHTDNHTQTLTHTDTHTHLHTHSSIWCYPRHKKCAVHLLVFTLALQITRHPPLRCFAVLHQSCTMLHNVYKSSHTSHNICCNSH